jgi:DNA processing protein
VSACERCLARAWLLGALSGHIDRARAVLDQVLALDDHELIAAVGGRTRGEFESALARFEPDVARERARTAELALICRCDPEYPRRLRSLAAPPAVLHVAGSGERFRSLASADPVAVVGARRA